MGCGRSYLFNPFTLVSTWAMSLSGLHIACTIFAVFMAQKGKRFITD